MKAVARTTEVQQFRGPRTAGPREPAIAGEAQATLCVAAQAYFQYVEEAEGRRPWKCCAYGVRSRAS
jgi:hypothetical protein